MTELINERRKDKSANTDDMVVNLLAACEGSETGKLLKLIDEDRQDVTAGVVVQSCIIVSRNR
jgi:hypothetical protein